MSTTYDRPCPTCSLPTYGALSETFGPTGSMHSTLRYRHVSSEREACARPRTFATADSRLVYDAYSRLYWSAHTVGDNGPASVYRSAMRVLNMVHAVVVRGKAMPT